MNESLTIKKNFKKPENCGQSVRAVERAARERD